MLDGGQMNLFRKLAGRPETKKIQSVTENEVQEVLQYMEGLPLPHPNKTLKLELLDGRNLTRRCRPAVKAQWYLLVFDEEGQGAFNAGYVLKQGQELLRARRIATKILRQIPEEAADRHCLGALAIGMKHASAADVRWEEPDTEHFFICQKSEERWIEKVFATSGKMLTADMQTGVRIIRKENAIHIAAGSCFGRNRELSEFHAGEVLGALMAAAEELWIDLDMIDFYGAGETAGPDYLVTVCRAQDLETILIEDRENKMAQGRKRQLQNKPVKEHRWKYA